MVTSVLDRKGGGGGAGLLSDSTANGAVSITPVLVVRFRSPYALSDPR